MCSTSMFCMELKNLLCELFWWSDYNCLWHILKYFGCVSCKFWSILSHVGLELHLFKNTFSLWSAYVMNIWFLFAILQENNSNNFQNISQKCVKLWKCVSFIAFLSKYDFYLFIVHLELLDLVPSSICHRPCTAIYRCKLWLVICGMGSDTTSTGNNIFFSWLPLRVRITKHREVRVCHSRVRITKHRAGTGVPIMGTDNKAQNGYG